jgi:hypothetical protein
MGQTSFGRMESFIFLYIWNQKCSIHYPVLHNYYAAWFSLVRLLFFSQVWQNYLLIYICVRDIEFTYLYDVSIECWNCSDSVLYIFSFYYRLWKKTQLSCSCYRNIVEICKFDIPNTDINYPYWLSSGTSMKSDGVKLVYSRFF